MLQDYQRGVLKQFWNELRDARDEISRLRLSNANVEISLNEDLNIEALNAKEKFLVTGVVPRPGGILMAKVIRAYLNRAATGLLPYDKFELGRLCDRLESGQFASLTQPVIIPKPERIWQLLDPNDVIGKYNRDCIELISKERDKSVVEEFHRLLKEQHRSNMRTGRNEHVRPSRLLGIAQGRVRSRQRQLEK
jgi:hypothetical protein